MIPIPGFFHGQGLRTHKARGVHLSLTRLSDLSLPRSKSKTNGASGGLLVLLNISPDILKCPLMRIGR
jgi:hypothetical protein